MFKNTGVRLKNGPATLSRAVVVLAAAAAVVIALAVFLPAGSDRRVSGAGGAGRSAPSILPAQDGTGGPLRQLSGHDGCVKGPGSASWTRCAARAGGLEDARSVAISPDGRFVYVASENASSVVAFSRNRRTGAIAQLRHRRGCVKEVPATRGCRGATGLHGAYTVAMSRDGRNVYVASIDGDTIAAFSRNRRTGALSQLRGAGGCLRDTRAEDPGPGCQGTANGLHGVRFIAVSPDGRNAYTSSTAGDAIAAFSRDPKTGALAQLPGDGACIEDVLAQAGTDCPVKGPGLNYARALTITPDGRNVYVASNIADSAFPGDPADGDAVSAFSRDPATGALKQLDGDAACIKAPMAPKSTSCNVVANGLGRGVFGVTASPDGRNVYAVSNDGDSISAFSRDASTGALTELPGADACVRDVNANTKKTLCRQTGPGLDGASTVDITPDGRFAYVAAFYGTAIAMFSRNRDTGALHQLAGAKACVDDPHAPSKPATTRCPSHVNAIEGPRGVAISPDGRNAYVPASVGADVAVFKLRGR